MLDYISVPAFSLSIGDVIQYEFEDVTITDIALGHGEDIMIEFFKDGKQQLIKTEQSIEFFRSYNG